jgi:calcineurin-like phosphoesterase family protein
MRFSFAASQAVFLTADTHFGHLNIIKYCNRPFADVQSMNEEIVRRWNETVSTDAVVLHLGDVCMGQLHLTLACVARLNGTKHLIAGNHDRCYYTPAKAQMYLDAGFASVQDQAELEVAGTIYDLIHMPFPGVPAPHEAQRSSYEKAKLHPSEDTGRPLLCGHVHDAWVTRQSALGTPMFNVGMDVHDFRPVTLEAVTTRIP